MRSQTKPGDVRAEKGTPLQSYEFQFSMIGAASPFRLPRRGKDERSLSRSVPATDPGTGGGGGIKNPVRRKMNVPFSEQWRSAMQDYKCAFCKTLYPAQETKPTCNVKTGCKNGTFVNVVVAPTTTVALVPPASYSPDTNHTVNQGYTGGGIHKPAKGSVYIHNDGEYAIALDGSTHSSGNAAWKGFKNTSTGWIYLGSYNANLTKVERGKSSKWDVIQLPL